AHMFRDRDSGYRLAWQGKTAVVRVVAPEKICFEVRASIGQDGVLHEAVTKAPASAEDMALLPPARGNPTHCDHFAIFTDAAPVHLASIVLQADRYEEQCATELPWAPRAHPSRLVMYYYGDAWKSGLFYRNFYVPDTGVTFVAPVGDDTMRHEITHQIVDFSIKGEFPLWFNEGIAEYYGHHTQYAGDGFIPYRDPDEIKSIQHFLQGKWPGQWGKVTIPGLIHMNYGRWVSLKHGPYPLAWSLVYFLEHGDKDAHRHLVEDYMKTVAAGQQGAQARDEKFEAAVLALEPAWRKYWTAMPADPDAIVAIQARARLLVLLTRQAEAQKLPVANAGSIVTMLQKNQIEEPADRAEWVTPYEMAAIAHWYTWWADKWKLTDGAQGPAWACTLQGGTVVKAWFEPRDGVAHTASSVTLPGGTLLASSDAVSAAGEAAGPIAGGLNPPSPPSPAAGSRSYPPMPSIHDGNHPPMKPMPPVPSVHDGNHPPMPAMPAVSPGATPPGDNNL
ncbi:MAG TPA: DUF1570 domain-containing protein, partial [Chthoniobacteraceae bacterium]|nr:DUF1570 domain-containing protein [Chthoniobacteraceae bacterium]